MPSSSLSSRAFRRITRPVLLGLLVVTALHSPLPSRAQEDARPKLEVRKLEDHRVELRWVPGTFDTVLERTDRLGVNARWSAVAAAPTLDAGAATVTLAAEFAPRFFRLRLLAGAASRLPSVRLVAPAPETAIAIPAEFPLNALAESRDGRITQVEFLANGASLGIDTAPPYEVLWRVSSPGAYELFARVTDDMGATVRSAGLRITAYAPGNPPPTTWSSSPAHGDREVAVQRETVLRFSAPLSSQLTPNAGDLIATVGERRLLTRLELAADRRALSVFYLEPLPGSSRVRLTWDGARFPDVHGRAVDADLDGQAGGRGLIEFSTLSTTPLNGSSVIGRIFTSQLQESGSGPGNFLNTPLGGVTITVDGQEESLRTTTDAQGNFRLAPVPSGPFFVHIDGRTVVDPARGLRYPDMAYYPNVNKRWEGRPGEEVVLDPIYLPRIPAGTLRPLQPAATTLVEFPPEFVATQPQFDGVRLLVPPDSLFSPNGSRGGRVGIAAVPPDRLPQPLPLGLEIQDVITIQTDGGENFAVPVPACFPNLPDPQTGQPLPPRAKSALWSFNHDTGRFEIVGAATVSDDGRLVCTDPGVGILAPGWHGTREGTQGSGGPIVSAPGASGDGPGTPPGATAGGGPSGPSPAGPGPLHGGGAPDHRDQPPGPSEGPPPGSPEFRRGPKSGGDFAGGSQNTTGGDADSTTGGGGGGGGNRDETDEDDDPDACETEATAGKPIQLATGEEHHQVVDLRIRGRGLDFVWARTYRSRTGSSTPMGHHWDHSYHVGLYPQGADLVLRDGTGRQDVYRLHADGSYRRDEFFRRLVVERDGSLTATFANQGRWNFHPFLGDARDGRLRQISDRNGNRLLLSYDTAGRLTNILDTLDRPIRLAYHTSGFLSSITDFTGRTVRYEYYGADDPDGSPGDLKSVTSPAVLTGPEDNLFPSGKTTVYTYTRGFDDPRLNHNLLSITDPKGQTYLRNTYATVTDPEDPLFDRVIRQQHGSPHEAYRFTYLPAVPDATNGQAVARTLVNDRLGNVSEHWFDARQRLVLLRHFTGRAVPDVPVTDSSNRPARPLRDTDPGFFESRFQHNDDGLVTRETRPNGNLTEYVYESDLTPNADPEARGNVRIRRMRPGTHLPVGDQDLLEERFEYATGLGSGGCCGFNFVTRHVDPRGFETRHVYDARGNRTRTLHPVPGVVHDYAYNEFGQLTGHLHPDNGSGHRRRDVFTYATNGVARGYPEARIVDADGLRLISTTLHDARGNPVEIRNPRGFTFRFEYNELDHRYRTISPPVLPDGSGYVTEYRFDANQQLVRIDTTHTDAAGLVTANPTLTTTYTYDILNAPLQQSTEVDASRSVTVEYAYDANRNRILERTPEAVAGRQPEAVTAFEYDERDLPFRHRRAPGSAAQSTFQMDYDGNGNLVRTMAGLESEPQVSTWVHDGFDRTRFHIDPMGNRTTSSHDAAGNRVRVLVEGELADLPGSAHAVRLSEITAEYDALRRLTARRAAFFDAATQEPLEDGVAESQIVYSPASQVLRTVDDHGKASQLRYDTALRPAETLDAAGNRRTLHYDAAGNLVGTVDFDATSDGTAPRSYATTNTFDALDRLVAATDSAGQTTRYAYDARGLVVGVQDPRGNLVTTRFDGLARTVEIRHRLTDSGDGSGLPLGDVTTALRWDDNSRLVERTDPSRNFTTVTFDPLDRPIRRQFADGTFESLVYDAHGNAVHTTDANGTITASTFDALNRRVISRHTPGPGVTSDTTEEVFEYDGLSRIVRARNDAATVTRAYDSLGRITRETVGSAEFRASYDTLGNQITRTLPSGLVVSNRYDSLNRLSSVADSSGPIATFTYEGVGRIRSRTDANGTRLDVGYDARRRPTHLSWSREPHAATDLFSKLISAWDSSSLRTSRGEEAASGARLEFAYDSLNRLVRSTVTAPEGSATTRYTFDASGNRLRVDGGPSPGTYQLDATRPSPADAQVHQYTRTPEGTRTHDAAGNLQTADGLGVLRFDVHQRLVGFTSESTVTEYAYDAFGRRIAKSVATLPAGSEVRLFAYDGWNLVEESTLAGRTLGSFIHGPHLDDLLIIHRGERRFHVHADDQRNVTHLTDEFGDLVESYRYDDYGAVARRAFSADASIAANPWLFTGRFLDAESGLYEFRHRYLDPVSGRFISRDPAGQWFDLANFGNGYTYVGNSPWSGTDPLGLKQSWGERAVRGAATFGHAAWNGTGMMLRDGAWATVNLIHDGETAAYRRLSRSARNVGHQIGEKGTLKAAGDAFDGFVGGIYNREVAVRQSINAYSETSLIGRLDAFGREIMHRANQSQARSNDPIAAYEFLHDQWPSLAQHYLTEVNALTGNFDFMTEAARWAKYEGHYQEFRQNPAKYIREHGDEVIADLLKDQLEKKKDGARKKFNAQCEKAIRSSAPSLYQLYHGVSSAP